MLSNTAPLRHQLERDLPERPFALEFWDGSSLPATEADAPTFSFRSPQALAHVLRRPGELGIGRAFVSGQLEVDDIEAALKVVSDWRPPALSRSESVRLLISALRAVGVTRPPKVPAIELRQRGPLHSLARDRSAIAYHYNAGNEFFALFLDSSMTYSCAVFSRGAETLEEAQETKLGLVCTKLDLKPGERLLDVGCGWGSFAIHAATRHEVNVLGITLSSEQARVAQEKVKEAGLADRVEIRIADYRELREEPFDAIASIGMVEHVGEQKIDVYTGQLASLLRPGGRLLNHGIARLNPVPSQPGGPVSERYVFPDGDPLPLSRVQLALERAGFVTDHVEGFQDDYAQTLREWARRLDAGFDQAVRLAGPERARVWRIYLRAARNGFETGRTSIYQVRCHRPEGKSERSA